MSVFRVQAFCLLASLLAIVVAPSSARQAPHQGTLPVQFSIPVQPSDTLLRLPDQFLLSGTVHVRLDGRLLDERTDYTLDAREGILRLAPRLLETLARDSAVHRVEGTYRALPMSFAPEYRRRVPVRLADSASGTVAATPRSGGGPAPFAFDDVFGSRLQKSGSIVRGLSIGSNRDLSLNSGFRMQLSGMIADDLELSAALTDENSPIQPEGTTQTLQEFDKVFVELKGSNFSATVGDFLLEAGGGEFSRFRRKLQGAKGTAEFRSVGEHAGVVAAAAVARGKYATKEFRGADGVQGPYRLTGRDNEREIIVIAGSERVYLNGEAATRGENQEYVIDYANAEVTFTAKRLITHATRIVIDFEYSDRRYTRTLNGAQAGAGFLGERLTLRAGFFRESDDKDAPIDDFLSDADRETLRVAGDDRARASTPGAVEVGPGRGQYLVRDSLVVPAGGGPAVLVPVYVYAPYDTLRAIYAVSFSTVGAGAGDYEKVSAGNFRFVGPGRGSYLPVRYLPMPESHAVTDFGVAAQIAQDLKVSGEFAASSYDRNRFSTIGDERNDGTASTLGVRYAPAALRVGDRDLGALDVSLRQRKVGARFAPLDRVNDVEFARTWNIADSAGADELLREGTLTYLPDPALSLSTSAGRVERGAAFVSNRYAAAATVGRPGSDGGSYRWEFIDSRDPARDNGGLWTRHGGAARRTFGLVTPSIAYQAELLRSRSLGADTLERGSYAFAEVTPGVAVGRLGPVSARASLAVRWDDSLFAGALRRVSVTTTQSYGWQLEPWNDLSSSLDLAVERRAFTDEFRARNKEDRENILVRWQARYGPFDRGVESDWYYEASSEQAAKLERVFQRVARGTGSYVYAGDLNRNNVVDEQDFRQARFDGDFIAVSVPTDALAPVVDVKASTRVRVTPSRFLDQATWIGKVLSALTTETYARVEERSSDPDTRAIYALRLGRYLSDLSTLAGSNLVTQDIHLFENKKEGSLRLRLSQRRALNQFATLAERAYARERSVRFRWQFLGEIANQVDMTERVDNLTASAASVRERSIRSTTIASDWSYRPIQAVEAGFRVEVGRATNADSTEADINAFSFRSLYALEGKGQLRAELTREEVVIKRQGEIIPFELTGGRVTGTSWLWRLGLEYRLTQFIQATISYDGRSEGGGSPVHTARAEVRAFF